MLESLKPLYNSILRPLARLFFRIGLHPNHVTLIGLGFFTGAGVCAGYGRWSTAFVMAIIGACMDGLDGVLARESNMKSEFGAILDSSCDRLTEMALIGGLLVFYLQSEIVPFYGPVVCFLAVCSSVMVSYVKARCEGLGIACNRGLLQRPERIILLCIGLIAGPSVMVWMLGAISLLGGGTVVQRLLQAHRGAGVKT